MSDPASFDWAPIRFVVFDVDGTLYRQRPLRLRLAAALVGHALRTRSLRDLSVVRHYRTLREELGDRELPDFEEHLAREVGSRLGLEPATVREIVMEWIDTRPLATLASCRYPGVEAVFDRVRASGRKIGVLSDYPARDKLAALGLRADHVVGAREVGVMKPHPRGLERIMELAGESPATTVLIGDRADRDGEAARRAGVRCLLRSSKPVEGWRSFAAYDDPVFQGLHAGAGA